LPETLEFVLNEAEKQVRQVEDERIRQSEIEDLVLEISDRFSMDPPTIESTAAEVSARGTKKLSSEKDTEGQETVEGEYVTVGIPYSGDSQIFDLEPSKELRSEKPVARIDPSELTARFEWPASNGRPEDLNEQIAEFCRRLQNYCDATQEEIEENNRQIQRRVTRILQDRKSQLAGLDKFLEILPFPLRRRTDAPRTLPIHRARIRPEKVPDSSKSAVPPWTLRSEIYESVLEVLRNMTDVMERSPSAFRDMDEEDLRTHFLVQLNGQFEGPATGETFNRQGKTDIFLPFEGRAVFIAECKFWRGAEAFRDALDQLLGYTSWRDTKTALLIFNQNKDTTRVLGQIPDIVEGHSNHIRTVEYDGESEFRFVLHHNDDDQRYLTMTVMVFDVPT
jgi:hypothetical protein